MVETSRDWSKKLPFALWAYCTSFRSSTGATPYSLMYDEKRLRATNHVQAYQRKMARAFRKRVKPRPLQKWDLVLRILRGAAWLTDLDENQFSKPTNVDQLKKYYVEIRVAGWMAIISVSLTP
ncbi:hypothetical protein CK203_054282 [Vitis vinifera]|uniref:Uncharacterized protein n=1 Tax=Vitis vinifera TaxID=29760 RepID=A0A438GY34_VITVI|nr:hypothetical protein CK203_054282 [Vitis vinifera]